MKQKIKEQSGRIGEPTEYTEFHVGSGKVGTLAQVSGRQWIVYYRDGKGKRASFCVISRGYDNTKESAVAFAKQLAIDLANGRGIDRKLFAIDL